MEISYKVYEYKKFKVYYITINGIQFTGPYFSLAELEKAQNEMFK